MSDTFYITTPIYYVNDVPHIGHAYTTIAADVLARYHRLRGHDVFFLAGLDEHGQKVQQAAAKAGISPQAHCDRLTPQFQNLWKKLDISNDGFIRTTDASHQTVVQRFLQQLFDQQLIYRAEYTGWYCTFDERFWTEKDVEGGLCPDCHRPVEQLSESNYFFKMSQYQQRLLEHIDANPNFIRPESRRNEVLGFLQKPLEDLSISRPKSRLSWGIELPFDNDYVTYVWFDALVNYVSGLEYLPTTPAMDRFWPASVHLVGKDILTTHAVYWSTMLMALDLPLPQTIFAHGWWTVEGEKMSKSRGNVIDPYAMVDTFGVDAFRYFVLREVPFGQDGDFSVESFCGRVNSDLANGIGNLLSRTVTLIQRSYEGKIPASDSTETTDFDSELQATAEALIRDKLPLHLRPDRLEFNRALESIWGLVQLGNQYIDKTAPWVLAKDLEKRNRLNTVLYHAAETLRYLSMAVYPFMPKTAEDMSSQLGLQIDFSIPVLASTLRWGATAPGAAVQKGPSLFPRIDPAVIAKQGVTVSTESTAPSLPKDTGHTSNIPASSESTSTSPNIGPQITIEDFQKIQLKVAKVLSAERVPKSNKLLKLQVDLGAEQRQIVAGIGKKYAPEDVIGKSIVVVANLQPAKLMGVESQGMVLAAGGKEVLGLVTIGENDIEPGTQVR
ncbi:methionine--tRNA ligase [Candidatus Nitronereus thalassa]|uniref:Methionine--tRNA ligase n=1 Tax=Candidatus Nitronereus thalassa TaxID=3020898 RepID=A0ABU3K5K1_9BACT|nr:methionine--tRNA ligase [Candidatus Nitronereus thalassa]MDT7041646.1 methionine--tRNA ligase [Candidatus Nitronereus thalassa]